MYSTSNRVSESLYTFTPLNDSLIDHFEYMLEHLQIGTIEIQCQIQLNPGFRF